MSIISRINRVLLASTIVFTAFGAHAKKDDLFKNLHYPELQVSPLASERLKIENDLEKSRQWTAYSMFQISALTTIFGTVIASRETLDQQGDDDLTGAKTIGLAVGGGWLLGTLAMSFMYKPYQKGLDAISALPNKTKKDKITRERIAEEYLMAPASLMRKLKWASLITNLGATALVASNAPSSQRPIIGAAGLAAFLPVIFKSHYEHAARKHRKYKKKIYGPVFSSGLISTPGQEETVLGLQAFYQF